MFQRHSFHCPIWLQSSRNKDPMPRLVLHFARYGPYHFARLRSVVEALKPAKWDVIGLEIAGSDATYAWDPSSSDDSEIKVITAFPGRVYEEISSKELKSGLTSILDEFSPDAMAIAGWGSQDARVCLNWGRKHKKQLILMSETREADGRRVWWKEALKSRIIRKFDAALVGGRSHRDYLEKLGMPVDRVRFGYNVVDNQYFRSESEKWRARDDSKCISSYFLASNRFVERKNLKRLIQAYALYLKRIKSRDSSFEINSHSIWGLCLLGDGDQKKHLIGLCKELSLPVLEGTPWESKQSEAVVYFPGFRQIEELPRFYTHAGAFVHPALEEPWGLVLNEAMACGLPVLSSDNVGAAEELVVDGVNGWTFDPLSEESISGVLLNMAITDKERQVSLSAASLKFIEEKSSLMSFGCGFKDLLQHAG